MRVREALRRPHAGWLRARILRETYRWLIELRWISESTTRIERVIGDLRRASEDVTTIEDAVDLALDFASQGVSIAPWQVRSEILSLLRLLAEDPPLRIIEIGTAKGGTLFLLTRVASPDARIVSIDLPGGPFGGGYPARRATLYKSFERGRQRVELVRARSDAPSTLAHVKAFFDGSPLDLLFIDGDHSYDGVKTDFDLYSPLVRTGGKIVFHDIVPPSLEEGARNPVGGVPRFWREVKLRHPATREFVADWEQGGLGIGVLVKQPDS
ncbi:MAG: class I SAM-dependent methyltransferase [Actinobacteria bacterium]|nr:class I SAM-dependent methyltransferase [Actinomycetota bacterium]